MNSFGDAYKKAADKIKVPVITANQIADEECRKKVAAYRRNRQLLAVAAAASVFLLCSLGVAAAAGYAKSVIRTTEYGFETADEQTALLNNGAKDTAYPEDGEGAGYGLLTARDAGEGTEEEADEQTGGVTEKQEQKNQTESASMEDTLEDTVEELEELMFDSRADFLNAGVMPAALPVEELVCGEDFSEEYIVCGGMFLLVRMETKGHIFMMNQSYYGDSSGHASSVVYPEGVCNERKYMTGQGYTYTVVDSVCEEGEVRRIHAAISVGDYELIVDFSGYSEEEAFRILDGMDLTVYL